MGKHLEVHGSTGKHQEALGSPLEVMRSTRKYQEAHGRARKHWKALGSTRKHLEGLGRHQEALGRTRCTRKDRKAPRST